MTIVMTIMTLFDDILFTVKKTLKISASRGVFLSYEHHYMDFVCSRGSLSLHSIIIDFYFFQKMGRSGRYNQINQD